MPPNPLLHISWQQMGNIAKPSLISEERASLGMHANNDPSEGNFATFTDILCSGGHINLSSASGQWYWSDAIQQRHGAVSPTVHNGQKVRAKSESPNKVGTFHLLSIELQDTLLAVCQKHSYRARNDSVQRCSTREWQRRRRRD